MTSSSRSLSIFDTTLRDGEQAPGNAMTVAQKVQIAHQLEDLGVNVIEVGFPAASEIDFRATEALAASIRRAKICAFSRANPDDIDAAVQATRGAERRQIEIMSTVSDVHLEHKRKMTRSEAIAETRRAVTRASQLGIKDICIGPEDATRADPAFLRLMILAALDSGATMVVLPDTVGACVPGDFYDLVTAVRTWVGERMKISVHAHNDLGLAVANTLAGIEAGADECQVTLCGIGERAGNAALEEVVAALVCRTERFNRALTIDTTRIAASCRALIETLGLSMARGKAVIGENAFATAAGIHQSGLLRNRSTYEFLRPEQFGRKRQLVITRHSGRQALQVRLAELGVAMTRDELERLYHRLVTQDAAAICDDAALLAMASEAEATLAGEARGKPGHEAHRATE
jgi:2-isopropylmalate synthase